MEKRYLLPEMKEDDNITNDDCWEEIDDIYDHLLNKLVLYYESSDSIFEGGSNAMPHIYEQVLLFQEAFLDEKHPEHKRAVAEWRAVLAIMALQRIRNVKLEVVKVDLTGNNNNPFLKAAAFFRPEDSPVFYQTTWDFLYIICMQGTPIALCSPITVVCPSKMFRKKISHLDWITIEKVNGVDELIFNFRGKGYEYANMVLWMQMLSKKLSCSNSGNGMIYHNYDKVMKQLNRYIEEYSKEADLEIDTLFKKNIYDNMNNSVRKEYQFLNNCCDIYLENAKMEFLVERYMGDIFQPKLLVLVYDDKPDAMFDLDNKPKIKELFHHVIEIDGKRIISVTEPGGEPIAAYVFLPFKQNFVSELMENNITAEEFFEEYQVIYDLAQSSLEVRLSIKGFPYSFYKIYQEEDWKILYGKDFVSTYLWPKEKINALDWRLYYTYIYMNNSSVLVDIPNAVSSINYTPLNPLKQSVGNFQLIKTENFPPYIRYMYEGISGYLPVKANISGMQNVGGKASIFIDVGHTSTYVTILKTYDEEGNRTAERISFRTPSSIRITGRMSEDHSVKYNFVVPNVEWKTSDFNYFRNALHSFGSYNQENLPYLVCAFENGQTLFQEDYCDELLENHAITFLDFDYDRMVLQQKSNAHIFVQEIMLSCIYEALLRKCAYIKVNFLHCIEEKEEKIGQLKGLWRHTLNVAKKWTGISESMDGSINCISEYEALTYYLYMQLNRSYSMIEQTLNISSETIYAGVDIGWKKTLITHIYENEEENLQARYTKLDFGGYDISMVNSEFGFKHYDEILSILLTGVSDLDLSSLEGKMIHEFQKAYDLKDREKCDSYYFGLFDLIAMEIEKNKYLVPSDIYNRMEEFHAFVKMMTYNILLLFLNIGYILGGIQKGRKAEGKMAETVKNIKIFLGGNGAKFLKWISNVKEYQCINEENQYELFIIGLKNNGILDMLRQGFKIAISNESGMSDDYNLRHNFEDGVSEAAASLEEKLDDIVFQEVCTHENSLEISTDSGIKCEICFVDDMKEQMVEGYIFQQVPDFYGYKNTVPSFKYESVKNQFQNTGREKECFCEKMNSLKEKIFQNMEGLDEDMDTNAHENKDIDKIIRTNTQMVCEKVIQAMNNMRND